jgi:DNA polymerase-3 subunit alpha
MFGGPSMREQIPLPAAEPWLPAQKLQREFDAVGFFLSGHPLDDYKAVLERMKVQSWNAFANSIKQGATAGRVAGTVVARAERRTKTGNKMGILEFSDPSGHYEAVIFQEGLTQYRDLLEPGKAVLLTLTAEAQGEDVRARIQTVEPLDAAAEKLQKILRVFVRSDQPIEGIAKRLEPKGDAEISMILILDGGAAEVEVKLPGRYKVSPQIAGAIKAVPGVVQVEAA